MQLSLDQIINVIMAKLEGIEAAMEDMKFKNNLAFRLLKEANMLDSDKLKTAIKDEFNTMLSLEDKQMEIPEEKVDELAKSITDWVDNDVEDLKKKMQEYQEQIEQYMKQQQGGADISVAPPDLINKLDGMKKQQPQQGKKNNLIIP